MTTPDLDLSIVIPVYNERNNLVPLEEKLETELAKLNLNYEIILIDDGSVDGSHHIIDSLKKSNPRLKLIRFGHNHGQSAAFAAGGLKEMIHGSNAFPQKLVMVLETG